MSKNKLFMILICFVVFSAPVNAATKEVALIMEKPTQKYVVISPLSAEAPDLEKIYKKIKAKARRLKADAVIEWKCTEHVTYRTVHSCSGFAIKWVN